MTPQRHLYLAAYDIRSDRLRVASALYLSARPVVEEVLKRAREYRVDVLAGAEVADIVPWIRRWQVAADDRRNAR